MTLPHQWNTIRLRLTLLYGVAFFIAGLLFIGTMYFQLSAVIGQQLIYSSVVGHQPIPEGATVVIPEGATAEPTIVRIERGSADVLSSADLPLALREGFEAINEAEERFTATRAAALQRIMIVSLISLLTVSAIAALLGWGLAGQALRPLRQITATARGIADRNLHQRINMQGPQDEIKDLADTLDSMLQRLDRAFDSQQRFIANASHELRTPLSINRTLIEVALLKEGRNDTAFAHFGANLLAINQRHERLIDGLLMLASSDQAVTDRHPVDMADVAHHVLAECESKALAAGVTVHSDLAPALCTGDSVLLERLLQNLIDNAIRYNLAQDGWIRLITGSDDQGRAKVTIENSGSVIPVYEVPHLFEPFRRLSNTERQADLAGSLGRRGAGLGLSIVRSIVTSHGGELFAIARQSGGLAINFCLPCHKT
jgi:signal transduction histidine kinase